MSRKICPFNYNRARKESSSCAGAECALWNDVAEQCAMLTVAQGMVYLLGEVTEKEVTDDDNNDGNSPEQAGNQS